MNRPLRMLLLGIRNRHLLALDLMLMGVIPSFALLIRLEDVTLLAHYFTPLVVYTFLSAVWKLLIFYPTGLYNRYWRYASVDELSTIGMATTVSLVVGVAAFFGVFKPLALVPPDFPRSVPVLDGLITMLFVAGERFSLRLAFDIQERSKRGTARKNALIVGAGVAGSMIVKEMRTNPQLGLEPICFLDDDPRKKGLRIHGVPVLGTLKDLSHITHTYAIAEVIIAMPTASGKVVRDVVQACKSAKVASKTIPGVFEILGGTARVSQIRDVQIEDLLRRGVLETEIQDVAQLVEGTRVMITGAGGSIGAELCRQISGLRPTELVLLGHGENSIFQIAAELAKLDVLQRGSTEMHTVVADLRDRKRMHEVFCRHRPQVVFHAAAHKHVGLMETNVPDAVTNNVLGTDILVELAGRFGVECFVMISSDKAVNPTSIMGVTKRVSELIVSDAAKKTGQAFVSVRFGNVLGSRGSVVPIFKQQIAAGGPLSISHPDAKRYFMTIPEAVQLVLQAAAMGKGGEVFVLDMGEPIKIVDLARDLIRLSGLEEGKDIDIVYTGLKHGEKVSEDLFFGSEHVERSGHDKIFVCRKNGHQSRGKSKNGTDLAHDVELLINAAQRASLSEVHSLLKEIVPEYKYEETNDVQTDEPVQRDEKPVDEIFVGKG